MSQRSKHHHFYYGYHIFEVIAKYLFWPKRWNFRLFTKIQVPLEKWTLVWDMVMRMWKIWFKSILRLHHPLGSRSELKHIPPSHISPLVFICTKVDQKQPQVRPETTTATTKRATDSTEPQQSVRERPSVTVVFFAPWRSPQSDVAGSSRQGFINYITTSSCSFLTDTSLLSTVFRLKVSRL